MAGHTDKGATGVSMSAAVVLGIVALDGSTVALAGIPSVESDDVEFW